MIGRVFIASVCAWLASSVVLTLIWNARSLSLGELDFRKFYFAGFWVGVVMMVVSVLIILPVFVYLPERIRSFGPLVKAGIGALVGGIVFLILFPLWVEIPSSWFGAIIAGVIVGLFAPSIGKD